MKKETKNHNYQGMAFKKEFINEIKKYICKSGRYVNVTEFCREAVREKMERLDELERYNKDVK